MQQSNRKCTMFVEITFRNMLQILKWYFWCVDAMIQSPVVSRYGSEKKMSMIFLLLPNDSKANSVYETCLKYLKHLHQNLNYCGIHKNKTKKDSGYQVFSNSWKLIIQYFGFLRILFCKISNGDVFEGTFLKLSQLYKFGSL